MISSLKKILMLNIRSIFYNFYLFPFPQAIRFPLLINYNVKIYKLKKGSILINSEIYPGMIKIGYNNIGILNCKRDFGIIEISEGGKLIFNGKATIGTGCNISIGEKGCISFGNGFLANGRDTFICHKKIYFSNNVLISWDCNFLDTDFHKIFINNIENPLSKEIIVNDHVWFGCNTTVLKGASIPKNCILGANSTCSGVLPEENCIYVGCPAKKIKENVKWEL